MNAKVMVLVMASLFVVAVADVSAHICDDCTDSCADDGVAHWHIGAPGPGGCFSIPTQQYLP